MKLHFFLFGVRPFATGGREERKQGSVRGGHLAAAGDDCKSFCLPAFYRITTNRPKRISPWKFVDVISSPTTYVSL